jgi:hypothetical protein
MDLPGPDGLQIERTDFVPGEARGVLVGLRLTAPGAGRAFDLQMDAHSELMSAYPWGETTAGGQPFDQTAFNLQDQATATADALVFTEQGTPPLPGATAQVTVATSPGAKHTVVVTTR